MFFVHFIFGVCVCGFCAIECLIIEMHDQLGYYHRQGVQRKLGHLRLDIIKKVCATSNVR
jgi:hypothetical protein